MNTDCIFCRIVKGEIPSFKFWEDQNHIAFLSIYPDTEGMTILVPKNHYSSYVFEQKKEVINKLMLAAKKVSKILDARLDNIERTCLLFEGFEIDHLHAKLYPIPKNLMRMPELRTKQATSASLEKVFNKLQTKL